MSFSTVKLMWRTPCFNGLLPRLLARGTSKIAVQLDSDLLRKLEQSELKPRHHPGVVKGNRVQLPESVTRALERAIGDYPVKALLQDANNLNKYINSRHPPPEQHELEQKMRTIVAQADERMPPQQMTGMCEEEMAAWRRKRDNLIGRLMKQRNYAWKPITYGVYEALVYAVGRSALEYGTLVRILQELASRDPDFHPRSYFDFGSGIGMGMWAASAFWKQSIFEYYNVDSSREMQDLAELVLNGGHEDKEPLLREVYFRQFLPGLETKYDLVISAFSLFELPSAQHRKEVMLNLWRKCDGYLVIVEEGTRRGSELVNEVRDYLLRQRQDPALKGHVFAPCAHDLRCPRLRSAEDRTPCNFEAAYAPFRIGDMLADRLTTRYSYVVLKKGGVVDPTRDWPRLIRPTLQRSKHAICRMCTAEAKLQEIIFTKSKHGKEAYSCAKASSWGDRLPIAVGETYEIETRYIQHKKAAAAKAEALAIEGDVSTDKE